MVDQLTRIERVKEECKGLTLEELKEKILTYQKLSYESRMKAIDCRILLAKLKALCK